MSYYNNVYVIFICNSVLDQRQAGQMLPPGAIPQAVINFNTNQIIEIINDFNLDEVARLFPDKRIEEMNYIDS